MGTKTTTPYGHAIALLLKQAHCSRRKAARLKLAPYSAFSQWKHSKLRPTVGVLDRLLDGLGLTWHDWARAVETASIPHPRKGSQEEEKRGGKRIPKPVPVGALRLVR